MTHKPNRVGCHPLVDTNQGEHVIPILTANFAAVTAARPFHAVQTDLATVKDNHAVSFNKAVGETWAMGVNESLSFGRFVPGVFPADLPFLLNVTGSLLVVVSPATNMYVDMYVGRLTSAPVVDPTAQVNTLSAVTKLPAKVRHQSGLVYQVDVETTINLGLHNGLAGSLENDDQIAVYWNIWTSAAGSSIIDMRGSLSAYKWQETIQTFDPDKG